MLIKVNAYLYGGLMVTTGANLGMSLTLNLEQYEDLAGYGDEAGVVVCIINLPFCRYSIQFT